MSADPVAWTAIVQGWSVLDADGNEIGKVDQVTGDLNADIFDGLTVGDGGTILTRARYVPSEHVAEIREGEVVLDLGPDEAAKLEPYEQPVAEPLESLLPADERPAAGETPADAAARMGMNPNRTLGRLLRGMLRGTGR